MNHNNRGDADQPQRKDKGSAKGFKRLMHAYKYSQDGLQAAWRDEAAFRQISILSVIFIILAVILADGFVQMVLLMLPCFLCVGAELINSAIENAIDFTSTQTHPLAKKAKDMGSAAQLVFLIFFAVVWGGFLWERCLG